VPAKMTSSMRLPRRLLADCSPSTQLMASLRLDLPHPLGPTIAAIPEPWNCISDRSQNDLKPWSSIRLSFSKVAVPLPQNRMCCRGVLNSTLHWGDDFNLRRGLDGMQGGGLLKVGVFDYRPTMGGGMSLSLTNSRAENGDWHTRSVYTEIV
jgi:hypothetical protein